MPAVLEIERDILRIVGHEYDVLFQRVRDPDFVEHIRALACHNGYQRIRLFNLPNNSVQDVLIVQLLINTLSHCARVGGGHLDLFQQVVEPVGEWHEHEYARVWHRIVNLLSPCPYQFVRRLAEAPRARWRTACQWL
jgi:hypothetical protein